MYEEGEHLHDSKDPNYDSAEEEVCFGGVCLYTDFGVSLLIENC